jgi:hypothetical protein
VSLARLLGRPVRVLLGDPPEPYPAYGLRPCDLADFEALAMASRPDPRDSLPDEDEDTPEHRAALLAAFDAAGDKEPQWGDDATWDHVFGSVIGLHTFLRAVLRDHDLDDEQCDTLVRTITPKQWRRLRSAAFGVSIQAELIGRIDRVIGCPSLPGSGQPWAKAVIQVCERVPGYTLATASLLTMDAINHLLCGGELPEAGGFSSEHASPEAIHLWRTEVRPKRRRFFRGEGLAMTEADPRPTPEAPPL